MVEWVDTLDLKSNGVSRVGSSPTLGTRIKFMRGVSMEHDRAYHRFKDRVTQLRKIKIAKN